MPPIKTPLSPANTTQIVPNQNPTDRQSFWQTAVDKLLKSTTWDWPVVKENGQEVLTVGGGKTVTGGFQETVFYIGIPALGQIVTPNPGDSLKQSITNNAAFTINATTQVGDIELVITNASAAGGITFSGFTMQWAGDPLDTVNGHKFVVFIYGFGGGISAVVAKALQ